MSCDIFFSGFLTFFHLMNMGASYLLSMRLKSICLIEFQPRQKIAMKLNFHRSDWKFKIEIWESKWKSVELTQFKSTCQLLSLVAEIISDIIFSLGCSIPFKLAVHCKMWWKNYCSSNIFPQTIIQKRKIMIHFFKSHLFLKLLWIFCKWQRTRKSLFQKSLVDSTLGDSFEYSANPLHSFIPLKIEW